MAVKVIEYGRRRICCPQCGSVLEYSNSDTHIVQTGMNESEKVIDCPVCETQITLKG